MGPSKVKLDEENSEVANMTLINVFLQAFGPMTEQHLCIALLAFQGLCCVIGLFFRYNLAQLIFD